MDDTIVVRDTDLHEAPLERNFGANVRITVGDSTATTTNTRRALVWFSDVLDSIPSDAVVLDAFYNFLVDSVGAAGTDTLAILLLGANPTYGPGTQTGATVADTVGTSWNNRFSAAGEAPADTTWFRAGCGDTLIQNCVLGANIDRMIRGGPGIDTTRIDDRAVCAVATLQITGTGWHKVRIGHILAAMATSGAAPGDWLIGRQPCLIKFNTDNTAHRFVRWHSDNAVSASNRPYVSVRYYRTAAPVTIGPDLRGFSP